MPAHEQAEAHLKEANELVGREKFNAAFGKFENAIRRHYGNAKAHADLGSALLKAGRFPEAVEQFRKAVELDPENPLDIQQVSEALEHDIRQSQDIKQFQKTIDDSNRAELFHAWARILATLQLSDQAIEQFKRVLAKDPEAELDTDGLSQALENNKTTEQQVKSFQEDVDKLDNAHTWNTWGKALLMLGRPAAAMKQFEKAVNVKNDWAEPYTIWGTALINLGDYAQAEKIFSKALKCDESSVEAYLNLGNVLDQLEEHQKAVATYQRGAAKAPSGFYFDPWLKSLRKLAKPDPAISEYQQAFSQYQQALDKEGSNEYWSGYFELGQFLMELGRAPESAIQYAGSMVVDIYPEAASKLQEAITDLEEPESTLEAIQEIFDKVNTTDRYLEWGQVLARMDDMDRAQQQLSRALEILSGDDYWPLGSMKDLVLAFESTGNRRVAQRQIQEALSKLNNPDLEVEWARILVEELNDTGQALAMFRKVLLTAPTSNELVEGFTSALQSLPQQASVMKDIQAAVNDAATASVSYHWALILINLGKEKMAVEDLERAIRLEHDFADARYQLARLYDQQGRYTKACRQFQKTLELKHDDDNAIFDWGTTLLKSGRSEEAIQKYLQVPALFSLRMTVLNSMALQKYSPDDPAATPVFRGLQAFRDRLNWDDQTVARFQEAFNKLNEAEAYNQWGLLLSGIGRYEEAIQQFKQAIDLDPDALESYSNWLKALGNVGLSAERIADYEQAIAKYRNNADAYNDLGNALFNLNWTDRAAEKYQKALEKDPKNLYARSLWIDCLINTNDIDEAREQARQLLADDPSSGPAYNCLAWGAFLDGDYDEAIKQCELGIENAASSFPRYLYVRCAKALYKSGREDLALRKLEEAIEKNPGDVETQYEYGYLLMEMNRYDEAAAAFQKVAARKPDHAFANHNLAAIPYDQGRYEEAWGKWMIAIKVYQQLAPTLVRVIEKDQFVDSYESYYHASVIQTIQHKHEEAETILKDGLDFDPYNPGIMRALAELNWERKEEYLGLGSEVNRQKSDCYWRGMEYFHRAEKLLKERSERYPNYYYLTDLGDLYLAREDYDKARPYFEEARLKDDSAYLPYVRLGVINLRERQPDKAIPLLQEALKRNPYDLDVKSSLAEAYLRAEKLDEAETAYRQVLNITSNHVQSSIGLGELCTALGDKKDSDRYSEAIGHFTRALEVAENEKIRSKYLKNQEKAGVYYQLGYARVQSYESVGIRRDTKLLEQALKDFRKCLDLNPSHQKAIRAVEKIEKRLGYFSRDRLTETVGPRAIFVMSIIIFVAIQLAFYVVPFFNRPSLIVSDKSLQAVSKQVPAEVLPSLATLKNQKFSNPEALSNALHQIVKSEQVEAVTTAVLQNANTVKPLEDFPEMAAGYYALLTFGSLLFMVVGLYLPQVLKLRVAGIELEKSSVDQAATGGTLGISK